VTTPELPPIASDLRDHLRKDIERRGVLVPVIIAHDGEILAAKLLSRTLCRSRHR
jgi:hypothetical protein